MTKPLTQGQKAFRANIRTMKAIGRANAKLRARTTAANAAEHAARNEDRRVQAIVDRAEARAAGIARRDAHNAQARRAAQMRRDVDALAERLLELTIANDDQSLDDAAFDVAGWQALAIAA